MITWRKLFLSSVVPTLFFLLPVVALAQEVHPSNEHHRHFISGAGTTVNGGTNPNLITFTSTSTVIVVILALQANGTYHPTCATTPSVHNLGGTDMTLHGCYDYTADTDGRVHYVYTVPTPVGGTSADLNFTDSDGWEHLYLSWSDYGGVDPDDPIDALFSSDTGGDNWNIDITGTAGELMLIYSPAHYPAGSAPCYGATFSANLTCLDNSYLSEDLGILTDSRFQNISGATSFTGDDFGLSFGAVVAVLLQPTGGGGGGGSNFKTRIVSFTPEEGSTTPNLVTFNLHVYINPDDLGFISGVEIEYQNIDQNYLLSSIPFLSHDTLLFSGEATTSGDFYFTATSSLPDGNYRVQAKINRTYAFIVNPFSSISDTQNHQFVVNQETYLGHLNQNGFREFNSIFGSTTATSTAAASANCNPLGWVGASSTLSLCLGFLFYPSGPYLDETIKGFRDGVATRVPWGYFYRMYDIFTETSTTTFATFTASVVTGGSGNTSTTTLTYDPADMLAGGAALVNGISDGNGHSSRDIMEPFVKLTVALMVLFTIYADLTKSHEHNTEQVSRRRLS